MNTLSHARPAALLPLAVLFAASALVLLYPASASAQVGLCTCTDQFTQMGNESCTSFYSPAYYSNMTEYDCDNKLICDDTQPGWMVPSGVQQYSCSWRPYECNDGIDNDGNGPIDYPSDNGCANASDDDEAGGGGSPPPPPPPPPQCSDSSNNDGDAWTDYPSDPGCSSSSDTSENPNPECSNGVDQTSGGGGDAEDTLVDLNDTGCANSADTDETNAAVSEPDYRFQASGFSMTPVTALINTLMQFAGKVRNFGDAAGGNTSKIRFEIDDDADGTSFGAGTVTMDTSTYVVPNLAAATTDASFRNAPSTWSTALYGWYRARLTADTPGNRIAESSETNNDRTFTFFVSGGTQCSDGVDQTTGDPEDTLADLADPGCGGDWTDNDETDPVVLTPDLITGAVSPTVATAGFAATFNAMVTNQGTGGTGVGYTALFQRADTAGSPGSCEAGWTTVGSQCRKIFTASGSVTRPSNWNDSNNTIECVGAGGNGSTDAGGGGGAYARKNNYALPAGSTSFTIGAVGTVFNTNICRATAGASASGGTGGVGGTLANGDFTAIGGNGGNGPGGAFGRGGGGGAGGPLGPGKNGGAAGNDGGGGGGGSNGGSSTVGAIGGANGGNGGNGTGGTGGGGGGNGTDGAVGTAGGGGGGGDSSRSGGAGGSDSTWGSAGLGGGGGGRGRAGSNGGNGGGYGGGGGGGNAGTGLGAGGLIVLTYTPTGTAPTNVQDIGTDGEPVVPAGGTEPTSISYSFLSTDGGQTRYLRACADWPTDVVNETDDTEASNCGAWTAVQVNNPSPPATGPANFVKSCNADGTQLTLTWDPLAGAVNYLVRLNLLSNDIPACTGGWLCATPPDYSTDYYVGTSINYPVTPSAIYDAWIHGNASPDTYVPGPTSNISGFSCPPPAPTCSTFSVPSTVVLGSTVNVTWSCQNATSCVELSTADGFSTDPLDRTGNPTPATDAVTPTAPGPHAPYGMRCYGPGAPGGTDLYSNLFTVVTPNVSVTANPPRVDPGGTTVINATCSGFPGGTATLYGPSGVISGPTAIDGTGVYTSAPYTTPAINAQSIYTLVCALDDGTEYDSSVVVKFKPVFEPF